MSAELFESSTVHTAIGMVRGEGPMPYRRGTAIMAPGRITVVFECTRSTSWWISSIDISGARVDGHTAGRDVRHVWTSPSREEIESDMPAWAKRFIADFVPVGEIRY